MKTTGNVSITGVKLEDTIFIYYIEWIKHLANLLNDIHFIIDLSFDIFNQSLSKGGAIESQGGDLKL